MSTIRNHPLSLILSSLLLLGWSVQPLSAAEAEKWSERVVDAMIERSPQAWQLRPYKNLEKPQWAYTYGLALLATQKVHAQTGDPAHLDYLTTWVDSLIDADGRIRDYEITDFNIDSVNAG
jgi:unsaturated rhamnogalacturonyl hydrolase